MLVTKPEHNINITCLFALAENQFVTHALAEWNRSLGDPVSLCILHGLHARRKSLGAEAATNTIPLNYLKSNGVLMNPGCLMRACF